jgi:hypothetical protein
MTDQVFRMKNGEEITPLPKDVDLNAEGCYHLACAVVEMATQRPKPSEGGKDKVIRREFARNAPLIDILADCSDNLNGNRIRQTILRINL